MLRAFLSFSGETVWEFLMRFLKIGLSEASLALRLPSSVCKPGHEVSIRNTTHFQLPLEP